MEEKRQGIWPPREGSWEEAVLTWSEQVEASFRRRERASVPPVQDKARSGSTPDKTDERGHKHTSC